MQIKQIEVPALPAWVNSSWFNTIMLLAVMATVALEASQAAWAPVWVRILTAVLAVFGLAAKPAK